VEAQLFRDYDALCLNGKGLYHGDNKQVAKRR